MKNSWLIALREWKERISARSFLMLSVVGPLMVLGLIYILFAIGGQSKQHWNVLIADPAGIMENKILSREDDAVSYSFADGYIETKEFEKAKQFQKFDALLEINEKVLSNKSAFVFYREKPSMRMQTRIQYQAERRLEEVLVKQFTKFSIAEFRKIKQPLTVGFRNVYDPLDQSSDLSGWVGLFYGTVIFIFVFLFGMTILRSVSREKSNRIVEVLLGSVSPKQLMLGKIIGIGLAAFFQFVIWTILIGIGLYYMRENLFPDLLDASKMNITELSNEVLSQTSQEQFFANREYNEFVELVYERINFTFMTGYFILFFVIGYFFYGSLFAAIGASSGSESDGQQFVLPLIFMLCFALYSGYYSMQNPASALATLFHYLPFTSPVVVMVKLSQGYDTGHFYELFLSLLVLILSALTVLSLAGRIYANGILQFGHRVRFKHLFRWMKN
jgi:ABC-2 type transport system permease protein